ncbi:MAG: pyridoxamine 5'-phosphate oxidase family protein [Actinomycetales bacterium]|nr:pyridoxamine 5'-phosphate oxidase family protein [Actinomycetales bacterium]
MTSREPMASDGEVLDESTSWSLLAQAQVGRLAVCAPGDIDIFPLNYVVDDGTIVFRTAEGTKLVEVVMTGRIAFEADGVDAEAGQAWSVVVKGYARVLERFDDIYRVADLPLVPWNAGPKERFVRITPEQVTGRRFRVPPPSSGRS